MEYQIIYDFKTNGLSAFLFPLFGMLFFPLWIRGSLSVDKKKHDTDNWKLAISKRTIIACVFAAVWIIGATVGIVGEYIKLYQALDTNEVKSIQGIVENVTRISRCHNKTKDKVHDGKGSESFEINGHYFEYSRSVSSAFNGGNCFGPIKQGITLRVTYHKKKNSILLLEELVTKGS